MFKRTLAVIVTASLASVCSCRARPAPPASAGPRIITFSPGLTSIAFDMGVGDRVIGVTNYCILPQGVERPRLGDVKDLSGERLLQLNPDAILIQQDPSKFESLKKFKPDLKIMHFELERLADVRLAMGNIGKLVGREALGLAAAERFENKLAAVRQKVINLGHPRVLFLMNHERPVAFGPNTWIDDMIRLVGGVNAGEAVPGVLRWREVTLETILQAAPDVLICQTEANQAARASAFWCSVTALPAVKNGQVFVVTDRCWTIPGPQLADLAGELALMVHPSLAGTSQPASIPSASASVPAGKAAPATRAAGR